MKVLVTGGTGFVGANVVRHLLARGEDVRCLVRGGKPSLCLDGLPVERASGDDVDRLVDGVDRIFHVAGVYDPGPGGEDAMKRVHVDLTASLLRAAERHGVRRVVVCSSSITVGWGSLDSPGDEDTPLDPDVYGRSGPLRTYHDTKRESEQMARDAAVDAVIVNPDYVVGAWDVKPTSGTMIVQMKKRWLPVWPRGGKCFVDADDVAAAHLLAMERGVPGRRYLLGNHNRSYREFMALIAGIVGRRPPVAPLPRTLTGAIARPVSWLGTRAPARIAGLERVLSAMQQPRYRSGRRAVEELGMPVTPLDDSIRKAYAWFAEYGYC